MQPEQKTIMRIGNTSIISENEVYKFVYKAAGAGAKLKREVNDAYLKQHTKACELIYHPFWLAKTLVIADRPPFPPKKMPNVLFVDAVSGYRGVFSKIPPLEEKQVSKDSLNEMLISSKKEAQAYVQDVQKKQINRSYILKKPRHEVKELELVYLPLWKVKTCNRHINETFYINGNTGESEKHMSRRWEEGKDLL